MKTILVLLAAAVALQAQAPALDAVSIKVNRTGAGNAGAGLRPGGGITATNMTLRSLIHWAWGLNTLELEGGPPWIDEDRFDIIATATGNPEVRQTLALVKTMLADRFALVMRTERRRMPVYALSLARADGRFGPSLRRSTADCTMASCGSRINAGSMVSTGISLDDLSKDLAPRAGRLTVNRTGQSGLFDLELRYNPDPGSARGSADLPSLFTAVDEQLGLKLEAQTADVEVFVIDRAEKPTEN